MDRNGCASRLFLNDMAKFHFVLIRFIRNRKRKAIVELTTHIPIFPIANYARATFNEMLCTLVGISFVLSQRIPRYNFDLTAIVDNPSNCNTYILVIFSRELIFVKLQFTLKLLLITETIYHPVYRFVSKSHIICDSRHI